MTEASSGERRVAERLARPAETMAALASGVGARAVLDGVVPVLLAKATGSVLIGFAAFCLVAAVWRQSEDGVPPRPDVRHIPRWLLVAVNGFLLVVTLFVLVGIWAR